MARQSKASEKTFADRAADLLRDVLRPDLARMAEEPMLRELLHAQWAAATKASRTGESEREYLDYALEQIGAAWLLSTLFLRVLEDRGMVGVRRIAGGGAMDEEELFRELFPNLGPREYLLTAFKEVAKWPGGAEILGPAVNPAWRLYPSQGAARALLDLFREGDASGVLRFTFGGSDTRFLGDLYEQISAGIRARFALLQTPGFVEEFILERTLTPAIAEFGLEGLRMIDPTCGSGHFLLGAFHRLLAEERRARPGVDPKDHVVAALEHVHGSDINPYAVAIARLRLALAAAEACGAARMEDLPRDGNGDSRLGMLCRNVVVADSLIAGAKGQIDLAAAAQTREAQLSWGTPGFDLEDPAAVRELFREPFHAVVGNPPYIASGDEALRGKYRELYPKSAKGKYTLSAPFTERFFTLATTGGGGFVGLINSNAFLKREFGKGLIEQVLVGFDLTKVVDSSGAYIPGHGTPTVILFGRNRTPQGEAVTVVMGRRGEPETPADPAQGKVWSSIAAHDGELGYEDEFITVAEVKRAVLAKHPWSLGGGGASALKEKIEAACEKRLGEIADSVGITCVTGEDDVFVLPFDTIQRIGIEHARPLAIGEAVRDWSLGLCDYTIFPYDDVLTRLPLDSTPLTSRYLWRTRSIIARRKRFGVPMTSRGGVWYELQELYRDKLANPLTITFAEVATHNHFFLDRGGKVFKQTAPVIKLPATTSESDHLALLAWLNGSVFCFLMKQVAQNKGAGGARGEAGSPRLRKEDWDEFFQFSSTAVSSLPVGMAPDVAVRAASLERLAQLYAEARPSRLLSTYDARRDGPARAFLAVGHGDALTRLAQMVSLQEELDWSWYDHLGLLTSLERSRHRAAVLATDLREPTLMPGHRSFEQVVFASGEPTAWFTRNGYELPTAAALAPYSDAERAVFVIRRWIIENNREIALLERPEHKRRWVLRDDEAEAREAARTLLLDRVEDRLRSAESPVDARTLVHALLADPTAQELALVCFPDAIDPMEEIPSLIAAESADYLAAMRHTDDGLSKRAQWERTWALQRREDAGEVIADIPVPPKYGRDDYRDPRYWSLRGKLDVPRERFISYPGAETDPRAPLFGWAGWDHLQRARALATLYNERRQSDGWDRDRLRPLLAGLQELVPWLLHWHDAPDPELDGQGHGRLWKEFVEAQRHELHWTEDDLRAWRPPVGTVGRKRKA